MTLTTPAGRGASFQRQTNGTVTTYTPTTYPLPQTDYTLSFVGSWPSNLATLRDASTTWTLRDHDDNVWTLVTLLDPATSKYTIARPSQVVRRNGLTLTFAYGSYGQLTSVTDSYSKSITFDWIVDDPSTIGESGAVVARAISQANLPGGFKVKYTYGTISANTPNLPEPNRLTKVEYTNASNVVQDSTTYEYGNSSFPYAITSIKDKNGTVRWSVTYDSSGRATVSEGPSSAYAYTVSYGADGTTFTRTVTNPLGKQFIYNFSRSTGVYNVKLTSIAGQASTNTVAGTFSYSYGTDNFVSSTTDEESRVTTYTHNSKGLTTQRVEAYGTGNARTTSTTWDTTNNVPTQIVAPGLTTDYTYTSSRLTQKTETDTTTTSVPYSTNGQTRTTTYTWSSTGQLLTVDGPLSGTTDKTTYTYDSIGFLATITNGLSQVTTVNTVNSAGQPTEITDPNGIVTDIAYDSRWRVTSITVNPGGGQAVTAFTYNDVGQVNQATLPNSVVLTYDYDDAKRLTRITNAAGEKIEYTYNAIGNRTEIDTKNSGGTIVVQVRHTYDELGRILTDLGAASQTTTYAYDKVDNNTQITDPRSKVYGHTFDELNRLKRETDPDTYQTNITFSGRDDVLSVTDARSHATTYVRNGWGDIIREVSPDRGTTDYEYDARGLVTKRTDARGQVTDFTYDGPGRLLTRSFPSFSAETITYSYDSTTSGNKGIGHLTGITDPSGTVAYTWNALGQMTSEVRVIGARTYTTSYTYDLAGNVTQVTMPSGRIVTYTRDSLARVTGVSTKDSAGASSVTVASSIAWRPFGPLSSLSFGNGLGLTLAYDNDGRITDIDTVAGGTTVQDLTYAYDNASNITGITDNLTSGRTQSFSYDNLNRLTSATGLYGTNAYTYDSTGNRTQRTLTAPFSATETYSVASTSNRLSSISNAVSRSFSYEASGQVSTDQRTATDTWTYSIDHAGRMADAKLNSTTQASFAYDGYERRIVKTNALTSAVTHYVFDSNHQLIAEMDGSTGNAIREYIWLGSLPLGYVDYLSTGGASRLFFFHDDHLARPHKNHRLDKGNRVGRRLRPLRRNPLHHRQHR